MSLPLAATARVPKSPISSPSRPQLTGVEGVFIPRLGCWILGVAATMMVTLVCCYVITLWAIKGKASLPNKELKSLGLDEYSTSPSGASIAVTNEGGGAFRSLRYS